MRIDYDEAVNPVAFKLVFKRTEMLLEAPDQSTCKHWVNCITRGMMDDGGTCCLHTLMCYRMAKMGPCNALQTIYSITAAG